jgi:hypothetical protein
MFFAMTAITNYWFVFFALAFLICLSRGKLLLFCALFPLALFTSGGGVVLYPLGNLFLLLQKRWKPFAWFFVLSTSCMVLYFYDYHKPLYHPSIFEAFLTPLRTMTYFFNFLGNISHLSLLINNNTLTFLSVIIGLILCSLFIYLVTKQYDDCFWQLTMCFVVLIALETTLTRSGFGVWQAASSRYSLYPLLTLVCVYIIIVTSFPVASAARRFVLVGTVMCALSFWAIGTVYIEHIHHFMKMKDERVASMVAFKKGDKGSLLYPDKDRAAQILLTSEQQHIYSYQDQIPRTSVDRPVLAPVRIQR